MIALVLAAPLLAAAALADERDRVLLADGRELRGRVVFEDEARVVLRSGSKEQTFPRAEVREVESVARSMREYLDRIATFDARDARAQVAVALWCRERDLPAMERFQYLRALRADPKNPEANEALGHRRSGDAWLLPFRRGWRTFERLEKEREDWNDAWEVETERYRVRANLGLDVALDAALDLESFYRAFFDFVAKPLALPEVLEPLHADLHREAGSYPDVGMRREAYFHSGENRLLALAPLGLRTQALLHEATHQLLHTSSVRVRSGAGRIPAWLDEGFAEYLASRATGSSGAIRFEDARPLAHHFREHAVAQRPYELSRVLLFDTNDFYASTKSALKYAQAYTLVHYGLEGEGGALRERFFAFLAEAYRGRASPTDFKRIVVPDERTFERDWHEHARRLAGR